MSKSITLIFDELDQVDIDNNIDEINNQVDYWESKGYLVYNESDNPEHIVPRPKRPI